MFTIIGYLTYAASFISALSLVYVPFNSFEESKLYALWGLFVIGFIGSHILLLIEDEYDSIKKTSSSLLLFVGFCSGVAIFCDAMDWIRVIHFNESLWIEFILCIVAAIAIREN